MTIAARKVNPGQNLELLIEACQDTRELLLAAGSRQSEGQALLKELNDKLRLAEDAYATAETVKAIALTAGKPFDVLKLAEVKEECDAVRAERASVETSLRGIPRVIDVLLNDLSVHHEQLSHAIHDGSRELHKKAERLHSEGVQALRNAFAIIETLDDVSKFRADVPSLSGEYTNAYARTDVSPEIVAELSRFEPALRERGIALRRLLRS